MLAGVSWVEVGFCVKGDAPRDGDDGIVRNALALSDNRYCVRGRNRTVCDPERPGDHYVLFGIQRSGAARSVGCRRLRPGSPDRRKPVSAAPCDDSGDQSELACCGTAITATSTCRRTASAWGPSRIDHGRLALDRHQHVARQRVPFPVANFLDEVPYFCAEVLRLGKVGVRMKNN